jgi:NAD(P)-dependent dehydrogenase (short-subunit alcohol dehydrogenase family)
VPPRPVDSLLDFAVVPGFSSAGYRLRERGFAPTPDLTGKAYLVTGASSGLGAAACELLAAAGAGVHMLVRDEEKGERVRAEIAGRAAGGDLRLWRSDLARPDSVREFAAAFAGEVGELDALVNNAGVMAPERTHTPEGVELTFATNVVGPFQLTALLLPALQAAGGRIVNVSSGGMYTAKLDGDDLQLELRDFDPSRFYAHTKRCEVVLTELWQERISGTGMTAHSMHPGWADTPGVRASLPTFRKVMRPLLRDERQGADTIAWLCWAPEPVADPGRFWHDRRPRPTHRVPWTREEGHDRRRLWDECERLSGGAYAGSGLGGAAAGGGGDADGGMRNAAR